MAIRSPMSPSPAIKTAEYQVSIYDGAGQVDLSRTTGYAPHLLATISDPFSSAAGPLDVALGDFTGSGISELADLREEFESDLGLELPVTCECGHQWTAELARDSGRQWVHRLRPRVLRTPTASTWPPSAWPTTASTSSSPPGHERAWKMCSSSRTAGKILGRSRRPSGVPVKSTDGLSVSAGNLTNNGLADIVVGSQANGKVAAYSEDLRRWVWTGSPWARKSRMSASRSTRPRAQPGSIVVTGVKGGVPKAAIVPWDGTAKKFSLSNIAWIGRAGAAGCRLRLSARYYHSLRGHCRRFFFVQI